MTRNGAAIQLLYDNLAALPSAEYGVINLLPFAHDTETTRVVKRQVCEAIIELLDNNRLLNNEVTPVEPVTNHVVSIKCVTCANMLVETMTDANGNVMVDSSAFIAALARLNPQCPHAPITPEDLRLRMEREFMAQVQSTEGGEE